LLNQFNIMADKAQPQSIGSPLIHTIHEPKTGTWQYIVADPSTRKAVIIDSVLDFDPATSSISTPSADNLLEIVRKESYTVEKILETHAHADHLTASYYLKQQLCTHPEICIGARIGAVQATWAEKYGIEKFEYEGVFDKLFEDDENFAIGGIQSKVIHLPGHTPDHVGYLIGPNVFAGDSIFNPDIGSARCDFPGGSAADLFASTKKLLSMPGEYKLYTGHDYPDGRDALSYTTVAVQRETNKYVKNGTNEEDFVKWRRERDSGLGEPKLLHQALQTNIRAGRLPAKNKDGLRLFSVPIKGPVGVL
jgi:glyoxylase-like metal-dependent hydrolase (beta-lactamase superfamily II)